MRRIKVPKDPEHRPTCHPPQVNTLKISRLALNTRLLYPRHRDRYTAIYKLSAAIRMYDRHYTTIFNSLKDSYD